MPHLPDEVSADRLLKNLSVDLNKQRLTTADLRRFGWFQFRDHDRPRTAVSTELAAAAFLYLCFDAAGSWRRSPGVLTAVLAFLARYHPGGATASDLQLLRTLIDAKPLDADAVRDWFVRVYPPAQSAE